MDTHERLERDRLQASRSGVQAPAGAGPQADAAHGRGALPASAWQALLGAMYAFDRPHGPDAAGGDVAAGSEAGRGAVPKTGARIKKGRRRGGSRGRGKQEYRYEDPKPGPEDGAWQRSGADIRAAWNALEAQGSRAQPFAQLRRRNLAERFTSLLQVLDITGVGLQAPWDYLSPGSASAETEPGPEPERLALDGRSGPAAQKPEEGPGVSGAKSAGNRHEYIELPLWGTAGAAAYEAGGWTVAGRLADAMAASAAAATRAARHPASKAVGATALLAGLTYAWYSMFGRGGASGASEREDLMPGELTGEERALLDSIVYPRAAFQRPGRPGLSEQPPLAAPFNASEVAELERMREAFEATGENWEDDAQLIAGMQAGAGNLAAPALESLRGLRGKRSLDDVEESEADGEVATPAVPVETPAEIPPAPVWNQEYWERSYEAAADSSPEKPILAVLKAGPQPSGTYSLAVPRELFPMKEPWCTRMDQLDFGAFTSAFITRFLKMSTAAAHSRQVKHPDAGLPGNRWLHLGRYYELLYQKLLHHWTKALLRLDEPVSREYALAVDQIKRLAEKLNADWGGVALDATVWDDLTGKTRSLEEFHAKLVNFEYLSNERISGLLKEETWGFSPEVPASEFFWRPSNLFYLENIDLSKFTTGFLSELKQFMSSHLVYQIGLSSEESSGNADVEGVTDVHLVLYFTDMSLIATRRLVAEMEVDNVESAYNYAVLDEQLVRIIRENIAPLCRRSDLLDYLRNYNSEREKVWPAFGEMFERMEKKQLEEESAAPVETTSVPAAPETEEVSTRPVQGPLAQANWEEIWKYVEDADPLPEERINVQKYVQENLKKKFDETISNLIIFTQKDILNPDQYIENWIVESLMEYGLDEMWTPGSVMSAQYLGASEDERLSYTLREIVTGAQRRHDQATKNVLEIDWPSSFPEALQERLMSGISADITRELTTVFDENRPMLREVTRIMARRAALSYVAKKSRAVAPAGEAAGFYHKAFLDAVKLYAEGKVNPCLLLWHGTPVSGLIFIPVETAFEGDELNGRVGVILSIWTGDYYEVPWPGFVTTQSRVTDKGSRPKHVTQEAYEANKRSEARFLFDFYRPEVGIEKSQEFMDFMEKHRTPVTGRRLASVSDAFGYGAEVRQQDEPLFNEWLTVTSIDYIPPFSPSYRGDNFVDLLLDIRRDDLNFAYDYLVYSAEELHRATIQELFNTLSIVFAILLVGGGLVLGGPAWPWVLASLASTLLLDVVPNAILYSQADDEDERELYLRSMAMAIAFETGGAVVSEAAAPLIKAAAYRIARLASTAIRTTMPQWYKLATEKLGQVVARLHVEPVRAAVGDGAHVLSNGMRAELGQIIDELNVRHTVHVIEQTGTKAAASNPLETVLARLRVEKLNEELLEAANKLRNSNFDVWFRVVSRWAKATDARVENQYLIVARRNGETAVVTLVREKGKSAYVYQEEDAWLRELHDQAVADEMVIKYLDYDDFRSVQYQHAALSDYSGKLAASDYIEGAYILSPPQGYKDIIKANTGYDYDDIQNLFDKTLNEEGAAGPALTGLKPDEDLKSTSNWFPKGDDKGDKSMRMSEPIRKDLDYEGNIPDFTTDFDANELMAKFQADKKIAEVLKDPHGKCDTIMDEVVKILTANGFTNIRYRGMVTWVMVFFATGDHYLVIASKNGVDYAIDLTAGQFSHNRKGISGPMIVREEDWAKKYAKGERERLTKYKDYYDIVTARNELNEDKLMEPDKFIKDGVVLTMPEWYLAFINARVETLARQPDIPLSEKIMLGSEGATWMNFDLQHPPKASFRAGDMWSYRLAKQAEGLDRLGSDIKEFYPIPENLGMRKLDQKARDEYAKSYSDNPILRFQYEKMSDSIFQMSTSATLNKADRAAVMNVKESFRKAVNSAEKILAVIMTAEASPEILDLVVGILARFLNTKNIDILSEAYKRLKEIARRTYDMAHFHYIDQSLARVIPLRPRPGAASDPDVLTEAFVFPYDPATRIYVILEHFPEWSGAETLMHELTHLSVGSLDFQYLESSFQYTGVPGMKQAHSMFGSTMFSETGLQFGIGRYQLGLKNGEDPSIPPLTDREKTLGQARSTRLPMLSANTKMNNADSIVVLFNAILDEVAVKRVASTGMEASAWSVTPRRKRNKRSLSGQSGNSADSSNNIDDLLETQRDESVLAALIVQGWYAKKEDILSELELDEYDIDL